MVVLLPSPQQCLQGLRHLPARHTTTPALPPPGLAQEPDTPSRAAFRSPAALMTPPSAPSPDF